MAVMHTYYSLFSFQIFNTNQMDYTAEIVYLTQEG